MIDLDLFYITRVHFIGIGGIGVSALARMMLMAGKKVSGSDLSASRITEELERRGAEVSFSNAAENIPPDVELVVYSIAVRAGNPELERARELRVPLLSYPELLGLVSKNYFTIAVSGTHGKTTTTAMIATIFLAAGLDPTVVVGSILRGRDSNFVAGTGKYFVVEACEYERSFLHLSPHILVITNIDNDHLDYYRDVHEIAEAFRSLAHKVPSDGFVVCDPEHPLTKEALQGVRAHIIDYRAFFDAAAGLPIVGEHNKKNAACALAVADMVNIARGEALRALQNFPGTWRRFEYKGKSESGALVFDDYGHHPTEIKATLRAAREQFPDSRIVVAFQPHLYSRTKILRSEFGDAFGDADRVLLAPIYAAREAFDPTISSDALAGEIQASGGSAESFSGLDELTAYASRELRENDVFITMGAGDIFKAGEALVHL